MAILHVIKKSNKFSLSLICIFFMDDKNHNHAWIFFYKTDLNYPQAYASTKIKNYWFREVLLDFIRSRAMWKLPHSTTLSFLYIINVNMKYLQAYKHVHMH